MTPLRAVLRLASSSLVAVAAAVVLGKVQAVVLGPGGVARYSLLQTIVNLMMIPASFGTAQAVVRLSGEHGATNAPAFGRARRAAARVRAAGGALCLGVALTFASPISTHLLGRQVAVWEVWLAGAAVAANLVVTHDLSLLATAKRVTALARFTLVDAVVGTVAAAALLVALGSRGVAPSLLGGTLVALALSRWTTRELPKARDSGAVARRDVIAVCAVGGPVTLALTLGTAVNAAIPVIALHLLSATAVGYYQVASTVAIGYVAFLVSAMAQDYYPRLASAAPVDVNDTIDHEQRLVFGLVMPLIFGSVASAPIIVRLGFSGSFSPATGILRWLMLADALRFGSWVISFAILARLPMRWHIGTEMFGGIAIATSTVLSIRFFGLSGLGIAWLIAYALYYACVLAVAKRLFEFRYGSLNRRLIIAAGISVITVAIVVSIGSPVAIASISGLLALVWAGFSVRVVIPELRGSTSLSAPSAVPSVGSPLC